MILEAHIFFEIIDATIGIEKIGGGAVSMHEIKLLTVENSAPQAATLLSDTCGPFKNPLNLQRKQCKTPRLQ